MPGKGTSKRFPHGPSIKAPKVYDALRSEGMSKSRAAAISNAQATKTRRVHRSVRKHG